MEVGLSVILDLFDSNQFMLFPQATSFFQSCALPLPSVSYISNCICMYVHIHICMCNFCPVFALMEFSNIIY